MILPIITLPNPKLRQKSTLVDKNFLLQPTTQKYIDDLIETMVKKDGLGLASVQVDKLWRIFAVATDEGPLVFVNPLITKKSFFKNTDEEGCLSIPEVFGNVKRSQKITVTALGRDGNEFTLKAQGLLARVIQHENDHLDGILFTDKASIITKGKEKLQQLKQA